METNKDFCFDHIPDLDELMRNPQGGWPGVEYAQICAHNARKIEDEGWRRVRGSRTYSIVTNKGIADVMLYERGNRVVGADPLSSKNVCWIDNDIERLTGLSPKGDKKETPSVQETKPQASKQAQV